MPAQHRGHQVRHRLAGAGAGFGHQHAAVLEGERDACGHAPLTVARFEARQRAGERAVVGEGAGYRVDETGLRYSGNL